MSRDNFSEPVKRALAGRVAYYCSNPNCWKLTAGPHSDETRALFTGHAAHICAASPLGPRFDPTQSPKMRSSPSNGIWLCRECGDAVDKDVGAHPAELLRQWKANQERMIGEIRTKGYSHSLELLLLSKQEPDLAKHIIHLFEDRAAFFAAFDAEQPTRVKRSLDQLRKDLTFLRKECPSSSPLDDVLSALGETVRNFYTQVAHLDLNHLRIHYSNSEWRDFETALRALRKAVGLQIIDLARIYEIELKGEFAAALVANSATPPPNELEESKRGRFAP